MQKIRPVFGTCEWASRNANYINGCIHDCKYCYSKEMAIRFKRKTAENWHIEEINPKQLNKSFHYKEGYIMFPSTHDISPDNLEHSIQFLDSILAKKNKVLIVSKPHLVVIKRICEEFESDKERILFRFTIGSNNSNTLKFWEPYAPSFEERLSCLKYAFEMGFNTSVSCEPILDLYTSDLISQLLPYITDAIWVGKPNFLLRRLKMNQVIDSETTSRAKNLINALDDEWILKLYHQHFENPKIKWKESIKKVVKIEIPIEKGLDI